VMIGFSVMVIRCDGGTDLDGVSGAHVMDSTTIVFKKSRTMEKWLCL
jgi:hypothetical protein